MKQFLKVSIALLVLGISAPILSADLSQTDTKGDGKAGEFKPARTAAGADEGDCEEIIDLDDCTVICEPVPCNIMPGQTCSGQLPKERCGETETLEPDR